MPKTGVFLGLLAMGMDVSMPPPRFAPDGQPTRTLLGWMPGEVQCDGAQVGHVMLRRPLGELGFGVPTKAPSISFTFEIDAAGRPLSIVRDNGTSTGFSGDAAPALAASRFAAGARKNCRIAYVAHVVPLGDAPIEDLVSYSITPTSGRLPKEGWDRIKAGGDCTAAPYPQPLLRAFPDFDKLPGTPGVRDWSLVAYDTDGKGAPVGLKTLFGTGNKALDAAARKAVGDSRFTGGARMGCRYPYWKAPEILVAPPAPAEEDARPAGSNCPAKTRWNRPLATQFPEPWRRRSIEGWAIVTYDIAPWGGVGNVKIVAAQPAADFGHAAQTIVQNASAAPSPQGATGCVETVRFAMGRRTAPAMIEEPGGVEIF